MKLNQLFEMPLHIDGDYRPSIKLDSFPSMEGLQRENTFLGELEKSGKVYSFWLSKNEKAAKVTTKGIDEIGQHRQLVVVRLDFKPAVGLPVGKELCVHTVYTHEEYRGDFLAGALYIVLARYGYSVVSDFTQYNGGKALWKKMSREAEMRKFAIRIWSDETSDWVKNDQGEVLKYVASNLADENIWQDISQHSQPTTLLVLQTK
jgi:hypothetical protein